VAKGLLIGGGEGKMRLEQVLLSENINVGDLVMTSIFGQNLFSSLFNLDSNHEYRKRL
jgi:cell shape-determining protein MreC